MLCSRISVSLIPYYIIQKLLFLEITVTKAEMESAKIPLKNRDYCTGELLKFLECRADMYPWVYKCHHEKHAYLTCEYEEYEIFLILIVQDNDCVILLFYLSQLRHSNEGI